MIDLYLTENDQTIHVVSSDRLDLLNYPTSKRSDFFMIDTDLYVSTFLTFGDMAQFVLGNATYDYAIPRSLWDSRSDWRDCVMLYHDGSYVPTMYNVKATFKEFVRQLVCQAVNKES